MPLLRVRTLRDENVGTMSSQARVSVIRGVAAQSQTPWMWSARMYAWPEIEINGNILVFLLSKYWSIAPYIYYDKWAPHTTKWIYVYHEE